MSEENLSLILLIVSFYSLSKLLYLREWVLMLSSICSAILITNVSKSFKSFYRAYSDKSYYTCCPTLAFYRSLKHINHETKDYLCILPITVHICLSKPNYWFCKSYFMPCKALFNSVSISLCISLFRLLTNSWRLILSKAEDEATLGGNPNGC